VLNEQFPKDSIYISWGRLRTAVVGALRDCRCRDRLGAVRGRTLAGLVLTDGSRPRGRVKLPGEGVSLEGQLWLPWQAVRFFCLNEKPFAIEVSRARTIRPRHEISDTPRRHAGGHGAEIGSHNP
jgi:hypothetical protein